MLNLELLPLDGYVIVLKGHGMPRPYDPDQTPPQRT